MTFVLSLGMVLLKSTYVVSCPVFHSYCVWCVCVCLSVHESVHTEANLRWCSSGAVHLALEAGSLTGLELTK